MTDEKLAKMLFGQLAAGAQWLGGVWGGSQGSEA